MVTPHAIIVLDGFGINPQTEGNAIAAAKTPFFDRMYQRYAHTQIAAHGEAVGLPCGLMGNSEVGHMNIGGGRVVAQDIDRINQSIESGAFETNPAFLKAIDHALAAGTRLHLMGLLSDGGVHSSDRHYLALLELCQKKGLSGDRVVFHAFLDGRDTAPKSAEKYIRQLEAKMEATKTGVLGTIIGRYFAMDRDTRWERVELAYLAMVEGQGAKAATALAGLAAAYAANESDEFVKPRIIGSADLSIKRGDSVIVFNYRSDRVRQITEALHLSDFDGFARATPNLDLCYTTMTEYKAGYPVEIAYAKTSLEMVFGEMAEREGLRQLRIAETEKYAHVTFFFNGGREKPFEGEDRILVPSPKVPTYDLQPEMNAPILTEKVLGVIADNQHDLIIMNFANPDMVGHTGNFEASKLAVESVDRAVGAISEAIVGKGGGVLLTADHGNIEQMLDPTTGQAHTAHTTNPVPLVLIDERFRGAKLRPGGRLADIVPTLIDILDLDKPAMMNGNSLLEN